MEHARNRQKALARVNGLAAAAFAWMLLMAACSERRDLPTAAPEPDRVTYEEVIQPLFEQRCVSCHSGSSPAARYDMTTLEGIQGNGTDDIPNAIAGDPQSLLVVKSQPGESMNRYYVGQAEVDLVVKWVVEDSLAVN
jgi:mono/diheme cytochrome c family protein